MRNLDKGGSDNIIQLNFYQANDSLAHGIEDNKYIDTDRGIEMKRATPLGFKNKLKHGISQDVV